jgi:hypothetical protein
VGAGYESAVVTGTRLPSRCHCHQRCAHMSHALLLPSRVPFPLGSASGSLVIIPNVMLTHPMPSSHLSGPPFLLLLLSCFYVPPRHCQCHPQVSHTILPPSLPSKFAQSPDNVD